MKYLMEKISWLNINPDVAELLLFISLVACTIMATVIVKMAMHRYFDRSSSLINTDPTHYKFLRHAVPTIVFLVGMSVAIYVIPSLRSLSVSIFAGAGILALIFGLASQQAFSNIISGLFIVIFKPFRVNDRLQIGQDIAGMVEDITLRHTVIRNFENRRVVIPNSIISSQVIINSNLVDDKVCRFLEIGISYDADIDKAIRLIQEEAMRHPMLMDNRTDEQKANGEPVVVVRVMGFGDSSVNLRAYLWAADALNAFVLGTDMNKAVKERFDKEGVEIPFPYRTLVYKKDLEKHAKGR